MSRGGGHGQPGLGRHARALTALLLAVSLLPVASPLVRARPAGLDHLLTSAALAEHLDAVVTAYPSIVRKLSIGRSHEGREIWALKISDNVELDEPEPEVVVMGQIHAREWISQSMALYLVDALTAGYDTEARIRRIVNGTEIYVIPTLNPDGADYDLSAGTPKRWRKNRQPIKGSSSVGIDLNRNFGFMWRCCGGGSDGPANEKYRGWAAWVAPETAAYRDFVDSRVVGARQQLSLSMTFHSAGEMVLWPYTYTRTAVPRTMSADDYKAFAALGRQMAGRNGYRAMKGSGLYVVDGDHDDWLYHEHRVFAVTFELAAFKNRYYPTLAEAAAETSRNREAVLWFLEQADCPYRAAGLALTHCGPLNDDFETGRGWQVNPLATDTATRGRFARGVPARSATGAGVKQRAVTPSGRAAFATGLARGASANANDVDGGVTSVASPSFTIGPGTGWRLSLRYAFAHDTRARNVDFFRISVLDGKTATPLFSQPGRRAQRNAKWTPLTLNLDAWAGREVRLLFEAADRGADSLVEAAFDDVRVYQLP
jgi:carboxypeptidase T